MNTTLLLIDIIKSGSLSFLFSKLSKAIGQKEISEIIAGAGWSVVGIDTVQILAPIIKTIYDSGKKTAETFDKIGNGFEMLGNFIEKIASIFGK